MDCSLIEHFVYYLQTETRLGHGGHVLGRIHTKLGILWRISHTLIVPPGNWQNWTCSFKNWIYWKPQPIRNRNCHWLVSWFLSDLEEIWNVVQRTLQKSFLYSLVPISHLIFLHIIVSNTYCVLFLFYLFVFVLCTLCCKFLWIMHFWVPLWYSITFI